MTRSAASALAIFGIALAVLCGTATAFNSPLGLSTSAGDAMFPELATTDNAVHAVWMECGPLPDNPCPQGATCQENPPCAFGMYSGGWLSCRENGVDGLCCNTPPLNACGGTAPACDGVCPSPMESCAAYPDGSCKCVDSQTACADSPDCTGSCGQGLICQTVYTNICQCVLNQSCGVVGQSCGGYCPGGDVCASNVVLTGADDSVHALFSPCSCQNTCSDGTVVWQCSADQPRFCDGNTMSLVNNCSICGCPQSHPTCTQQGFCILISSFSVQTRDANGNWTERGLLHYGMGYATQSVDLGPFLPDFEGAYRVRLVHSGGELKGFIDAVSLSLGGASAAPGSARMEGRGVLAKVAAADYDVLDATGATVELEWGASAGVQPVGVLSLTAREEAARDISDMNGSPMFYPAPPWMGAAYATYLAGSNLSFSDYWVPASGHPAANVTGRIWTDAGTLRAIVDVVPDNTRDEESDYGQFEFVTASGNKTFRVSESNRSYGTARFTYTPAAAWEHRVYEFAIPLSALGAADGEPAYFRFSAYGTLIMTPPPPIACDYPNVWKVMYANNSGGTWHTPRTLSANTNHAMFPQIVAANYGDLTVVWREYSANPLPYVFTLSFDRGASWAPPTPIVGVTALNASPEFEIAADGSGTVGMLYTDGGNMKYSAFMNPWSAPVTLDSSGTAQSPSLAANPLGGFGAAWRRAQDAEIYFTHPGSGVVRGVSNTLGNSETPDIAFDSAGTAHIVWRDANQSSGALPGQWDIWYAGVTAGNIVQNAQDIALTPNFDSADPQVSVDARDGINVAWDDARSGNYDILFARSGNGGASFGLPLGIAPTGGFSDAPRIASDGNAFLHVIWDDATPGNSDVYYTAYGNAWAAARDLSNSPTVTAAYALAVDARNRVHVAYHDTAPGHYAVYYVGDSGFGATQEPALKVAVAGTCANEGLPVLVQDQDNNAVPNAQIGISVYNTQTFGWDSAASIATNANGTATFTAAAAGYYKLIASKTGYAAATKYVTTVACAQATPPPSQGTTPTPTPPSGATPAPTPQNATPTATPGGVPLPPSATPSTNATPTPAPTPEPSETPIIAACATDAECGAGDSCENGECVGAMREPVCCPLLAVLSFVGALGAVARAAWREK